MQHNKGGTNNMVEPWKFALAIIACILMLAFILGMAFIPDDTKDWGISL